MSQSSQEPVFGADIYYYFKDVKVKGKKKQEKVRVRISERKDNGWYSVQRVRDGYISGTEDISKFKKE